MSAAEVILRKAVVGGAVVVALGLLALPPAGALAPVPGAAQVDGAVAEWGPADDVAPLYGNDRPNAELGRLSLRYDCADEVLYAMVLGAPGVRFLTTDPDEAYLRFGDEPKLVSGTDAADGDAPDAAWVDASGDTAAGFEMSAVVGPGTYPDLRVHAKVPNDSADGYQTVDLIPRFQELEVECADDDDAAVAEVSLDTGEPPAAAPAPAQAEADGLARTGAAFLPALVVTGLGLLVAGLLLRTRPWARTRP